MKLSELAALAADEHKAEAFLQSRGLLQRFTHCPYCQSAHLGRVRRRFYKCYACRRTWSPRKGSLLEGLRLPPGKFLLALKLFEREVSARRAARELSLAYNTVHRLFLSGQQPGRPAFGRNRDGRALRWRSSSGQAGAWGFG